MVKKILALILAMTIFMTVPSFAASFSDVDMSTEAGQAIGVLSELGILSGMGDGTFSPNAPLTRAQFAKIAVCIMGKTNEAVVTTDAFSDVKSTDWYSGYVNVVAKEGIITGYPDGSFGADESITYAQTITILIRLLGYDASDVGHRWPQGYVDKAKVLGVTDGVSFSNNDAITREAASLFIYRTLFSDMKNTNNMLVTKMDTNVYEDTVLLATNKQNSALLANQVQTDKGIFTSNVSMEAYLGQEGNFVVNDKNEIIAFVPDDDIDKQEYTLSGVYASDSNIYVITEEAGTLTLDNKTIVYMNGGSYVAKDLGEGVNSGSTISVFRENNAIKYAFVDEYRNMGPEVVLSTSTVSRLFSVSDTNTLKVIRKGLSSSLDEIELYDVLYYSEKTNTIYAYTDRVTGVYEDAYPMKSNVSKVKVSGTTYSLSTSSAVNKLNESANAFNIGDRVTLLLGEDGSVVDAVSLTGGDVSLYGVITSTGTRVSEDADTLGRTENVVTIMSGDGTEKTYAVEDDDYEDKAGSFCKVDFRNSYAVLTFPEEVKKSGTISKDTKTMGDYPFASNYAILEYEDGNETKAVVTTLTLAEMDGTKLTRSNVKHVELNQKGEIVVLYLNNASGNRNAYGVLVDVPETKTGSYVVLSGSQKYTKNGTYTSYSKGDCVAYYNGVSGSDIYPMTKIAEGISIDSYVDNIIRMNATSYTLSDDVAVYAGRFASELKSVSLDDALTLKGDIVFYSDRGIREGGKVRVIRIITG